MNIRKSTRTAIVAAFVALATVTIVSGGVGAQDDTATVPSKPTGLRGDASDTVVRLSWPTVDGADSYKVYRRGDSRFEKIGTVKALQASEDDSHAVQEAAKYGTYKDTGLEPSTEYIYRIKATSDVGDSEFGNRAYITTADAGAPYPPAGLSAIAEHNYVILDWTDDAQDNITGFQVLRRQGNSRGNFTVHADITDSTSSTYTDRNDVQPRTKYSYKVRSRNTNGLSSHSAPVTVTTRAQPPVPAKPTGLSATATSEGVTLIWNDAGISTITGYQVLRRNRVTDATNEYTVIANIGPTVPVHEDPTAAPATTYSYRVKARNETGLSKWSRRADVTTPAADTSSGGSLGDLTEADNPFTKGEVNGTETDTYTFSLTATRTVTFTLRRQDANADLELADAGSSSALETSREAGTANDSVSRTLDAGDYEVRVVGQGGGRNVYRLNIRVQE